MSALASGVVLVTCWIGDRPWGMTVTAFASVSADAADGSRLARLRGDERARDRGDRTFGVSILAAEQLPRPLRLDAGCGEVPRAVHAARRRA